MVALSQTVKIYNYKRTFLIIIFHLDALSQIFDFAIDDGELAPGDDNVDNLDAGVEDDFNDINELAAYVDVDLSLAATLNKCLNFLK